MRPADCFAGIILWNISPRRIAWILMHFIRRRPTPDDTRLMAGSQTGGKQRISLSRWCGRHMSEELTPNLYRYFLEPDIVSAASTPDGHVYSLPLINQKNDVGSFPRYFMNEKLINGIGLEMPKTLEEFNEVVYALKEKDPAGQGSENVYHIGGVMAVPTSYLPGIFG